MLLSPKKQFHHPEQQLWKHTNKQANNLFYYIHNEIYSMKSYVVNFHMQMSSSLKVREVNNGFHKWKEKWYVQSESRVMFFQVFSWKLKCNSFVHFTVHEENCREPTRQQQKGKNKMRWKLKLDFLLQHFYTWGIDHWLLYKGLNSLMFSKPREEDGDRKKYPSKDKLTVLFFLRSLLIIFTWKRWV